LRRPGCGMRPVGIVSETADPPQDTEDGAEAQAGSGPELPVLCTEDELHRAVIQNDVGAVLIVTGHGPGPAGWLPVLHGLGCDLWELEAHRAGPVPAPDGPRQYVAG
ncbi:transferase, partial [Streptomyces sp. SID10116]|nr:transferase [Streptomyces sp. SID10116]